jgi:hypothetical protein
LSFSVAVGWLSIFQPVFGLSVRAEKRLVNFLFGFFLLFARGMFAHAATGLTAELTEAAITAGIFFQKNYFPHLYILTRTERFLQVHAQKTGPHFLPNELYRMSDDS